MRPNFFAILGTASFLSIVTGASNIPAQAADITTQQASFLADIQPGYYLETFDELLSPQPSQTFSQNGFSFTASAGSGDLTRRGSGLDLDLSTTLSDISIILNFVSDNVTAIGGSFFFSDFFGSAAPSLVTVSLADGTSVTLPNPTDSSFLGFTSPGAPITSLTLSAPKTDRYAAINNLYVGSAVTPTAPPVPTPALLPGLLGFGIAAIRKKRLEASNQA